ncbi:MAG: GAF domain-containing protein, partial [Deltaproteobacteria bacterium]|nr:GAF domain-containing protein [Deltaproteobacteria bacterium]
MKVSHKGKIDTKKKGLRYHLLIVEVLIFFLPSIVIFYILYNKNVFLDTSQKIIFALTLLLILTGLIILRQIFDRFLMLAGLMKQSKDDDNYLIDIHKDATELHEISVSFNSLMEKLEKTTSDLKKRSFELFTIKKLTEVAGRSLDIRSLLNLLLEKSMAVTTAQTGSVLMLGPDEDSLSVAGYVGLEPGPEIDSSIDMNKSLLRYVIAEKKPLFVQDIETDPRTLKSNEQKYGPPSFISMPIFAREKLIAVLNLANKKTQQIFDSNDAQILSIMIAEIGFALENAQLHHTVKEQLKSIQEHAAELTEANVRLAEEINERKKAEEAKRQIEKRLRQAEKMEAIGTLAGGVAHDLNNVLVAIVGYPDLVLTELPKNSPLSKYIKSMQTAGEKAAAIVQDLLALARRGVTVTEVANLNGVISEYLNSPEFEKLQSYHPDVEIEINLEEDLLNTTGSPFHFSKTVMNLASNAMEAMPDGGKLSIATETRHVKKRITNCDAIEKGHYVVLIVTDTGTGISSEEMKKIFDPFYTKKVMGRSGTGLGMAIVWGTIKDNGGYIDVQSIENKGTTFTLYFPVTRQKLAKKSRPLTPEECKGKGELILVVDDVKEQREIASLFLSSLGYSVATVVSGEEAVEYLKESAVDLIVLDMIMDP